MQSLVPGYHALVIGASGSIGAALTRALESAPNAPRLIAVSRHSHPGFDITEEGSIVALAEQLRASAPFHLIIDATGALTINGRGPEKSLGSLNAEQLAQAFAVNTVGPSLLIKHLSPMLATSARCIYAKLSARVGSIADNHKGGWYGYRASKAALNMILQTAAIELARRRPMSVVAALQPGTVASRLSQPFTQTSQTITPETSALGLLAALDALEPTGRAHFIDYRGNTIAW